MRYFLDSKSGADKAIIIIDIIIFIFMFSILWSIYEVALILTMFFIIHMLYIFLSRKYVVKKTEITIDEEEIRIKNMFLNLSFNKDEIYEFAYIKPLILENEKGKFIINLDDSNIRGGTFINLIAHEMVQTFWEIGEMGGVHLFRSKEARKAITLPNLIDGELFLQDVKRLIGEDEVEYSIECRGGEIIKVYKNWFSIENGRTILFYKDKYRLRDRGDLIEIKLEVFQLSSK